MKKNTDHLNACFPNRSTWAKMKILSVREEEALGVIDVAASR